MVVTDIIEVSKVKSRVFLDGEFAFVLYKGELRLFKIRKGVDLSSQSMEEIRFSILPKRAKKRSLMLLQKKDYTEAELRRKLKAGEYPDEVIEEALEYVKSYHYIDDDRFCKAYINSYSSKWSRQQITSKLMEKGIEKERIQHAYEELMEDDEIGFSEEKLIREILCKKHYNPFDTDTKKRQKMYRHLAYKGFSSDAINRALGECWEDFC